jgi:hypothetical protein
MLRYVDEAVLSPFWKWIAPTGAPIAAILIPAAFFLSVVSPEAKQPNGLMNLAYIGALLLTDAVLTLGARQKVRLQIGLYGPCTLERSRRSRGSHRGDPYSVAAHDATCRCQPGSLVGRLAIEAA